MRTLNVLLTGLLVSFVALPTATAESSVTAPDLVGLGGGCDATVHTQCSHWSADGTCHLFVGGPSGSCIVYGVGPLVGNGGWCEATVHIMCGHWSAPGMCILYVGGPGGSCVIY